MVYSSDKDIFNSYTQMLNSQLLFDLSWWMVFDLGEGQFVMSISPFVQSAQKFIGRPLLSFVSKRLTLNSDPFCLLHATKESVAIIYFIMIEPGARDFCAYHFALSRVELTPIMGNVS
jgi:hypothetical protein